MLSHLLLRMVSAKKPIGRTDLHPTVVLREQVIFIVPRTRFSEDVGSRHDFPKGKAMHGVHFDEIEVSAGTKAAAPGKVLPRVVIEKGVAVDLLPFIFPPVESLRDEVRL